VERGLVWEFGAYRSAKQGVTNPITGAAGPLDGTVSNVISGAAPYGRVAYEYQWRRHDLELGVYGATFKLYPGGGTTGAPALLSGPANEFRDFAEDLQYQFIGDAHLFTVAATHIHESMRLDASFATGAVTNPTDTLTTTRVTATYYYRRKWGGTIGHFATTGSADAGLYPAGPRRASSRAPTPAQTREVGLSKPTICHGSIPSSRCNTSRMTNSMGAAATTTDSAAMLRVTALPISCCGLHFEAADTNMKRPLAISLGCLLLLVVSSASADEADNATRAAAARVAVGTCASCHGPQGHSYSPKFPVLAGQHASYLVTQLQAFRAQTRGDADAVGYMWGMSAPLDDAMMAALADYYGKQTPRAGPTGEPGLLARGKDIYQNGDSGQVCRPVPPATAQGPQEPMHFRDSQASIDSI